ncbi:hypothetical protein B2G71_08475 [Novosphingobium sp. PC22D]|uniref:xanthine dehydrogenase family protein molybdopterin-binding subunit n=1 Tax=Novosphingobium sp. PC22D TaxID=1962403 RepID=UPI000BFAB8CA|nr:molybdopterin cofactor-binding domain-containing protein [Novosphingobium sp. PC22D]PEQ12874.1 hypothetical protein B2G71_08475 [Novosphingobium sp. PC22D]
MTGKAVQMGRREILKTGALAGAALAIGIALPARAAGADKGGQAFLPHAVLAIMPDGTVTLYLPKTEMGQGVHTAIAMLIAEELEVAPSAFSIDIPPGDSVRFGDISQSTGGSTSMRELWAPLRQAAADTRMALVMAAARKWGVKATDCRARDGVIHRLDETSRLTYGEVCLDAAAWPLPAGTALKSPDDYRVLGKDQVRLDGEAKVKGTAQFGIDVRLPGMLTAALQQSPVFGGALRKVEEGAALAVAGVRQVVALDDAVAVLADNYWSAQQGLAALEPGWDEGPHAQLDQSAIVEPIVTAVSGPGTEAFNQGDVAEAMKASRQTVEAVYQQAFQAHAAMEPGNCVAHFTGNACEIWTGTQIPSAVRKQVASATGLPVEAVTVHNFLLGGGFGRRLEADMVLRTVQIARRASVPVKLVWSREEDVRHDLYRPYYADRLVAGLGEDRKPVAWRHHIAGSSIMARLYPRYYKGVDGDAVEGAKTIPYTVPSRRLEWTRQESAVPTSWWRGVGGLRSAFAVESFIDELAVAAKSDPVAYRRDLLRDPRAVAVLDLAAERAGWGRRLPEGQGQGVALIHLWDTYMAQVVEVEARENEQPRVLRVVVAVDCGQPVNPAGIRAQVEGGVVFGLSATLFGEITVAGGQVQQSNFHDYRVLRMNEAPLVETHIVDSREAPGGMGEPPTAAVGPALANAVFAATGRRVRTLPLARNLWV